MLCVYHNFISLVFPYAHTALRQLVYFIKRLHFSEGYVASDPNCVGKVIIIWQREYDSCI